jgi:hypothetical protein
MRDTAGARAAMSKLLDIAADDLHLTQSVVSLYAA